MSIRWYFPLSSRILRSWPIVLGVGFCFLVGAAAPSLGSGASAEPPFFEDITEASGLDFHHWNARTGQLYFPEMAGPGAALFDFDGDGDLDAYVMQGSLLQTSDAGKTLEPPPEKTPKDRLYRNEGTRDGVARFTDVTDRSGILATGYGMGVVTGDIDNDGHPDLFVANYGANQLWRNRGDGTFEDRTAKAGVAGGESAWSVGGVFFDYDGDGWLDLYVIDYVRFSVEQNPSCFANSSRRDYCGPSAFPPVSNHLFRNKGDGTFEERTLPAGLGGPEVNGASLGAVADDFDGDGRPDLYVANDGQPNNLFLNQGGETGTFTDEALLAGVALNREGHPEASMGVTAGDVDGDGDLDLFMTHLMGETNTLYINQGGAFFEDRTIEMGLAADSMGFTSFGTGFLDLDNDGWLDLFVASGAVKLLDGLLGKGDPYPLGQPNQLFLNRSGPNGRRFADVSERGGSAFPRIEVGRGTAFGDIDDDGDTDVLLVNNHGPVRVLANRAGQEARWIGIRLLETTELGNRDALGAVAELELKKGKAGSGPARLVRRAATDGSYSSANDPRLLFGLGKGDAALDPGRISGVRVRWADGAVEYFAAPTLGTYTDLVRGKGRPAKP